MGGWRGGYGRLRLVAAARALLALLLRLERRVALVRGGAHRAAQARQLVGLLLARAAQQPQLRLHLRRRRRRRARLVARRRDGGQRVGLRGGLARRRGAQRRGELLELRDAAALELQLLREALALAQHLVQTRLREQRLLRRRRHVALRGVALAIDARQQLLGRSELVVGGLPLGALLVERAVERAALVRQLLVVRLVRLQVLQQLRALGLQLRAPLVRRARLLLRPRQLRARAVALELRALQRGARRRRLVAQAAVRAEQLLLLVLLGLDELLEVRHARRAAVHVGLERLRGAAGPLQLLVEDLVLADHLAKVVGRRRQLLGRRRRLGLAQLLRLRARVEPRPQVGALGIGGRQQLLRLRRLAARLGQRGLEIGGALHREEMGETGGEVRGETRG